MITRIDKALVAGISAGGATLALLGTGHGDYAAFAPIAAVAVGAGVAFFTWLFPNKA